MKSVQVERSESKANMSKKEVVGEVKNFPENKVELLTQVKTMNDEQALTLLSLLETQIKIFTRPRLEGRTIDFADVFTLPRKTNLQAAINTISDQIEKLITKSNDLMVAGKMSEALDVNNDMMELLNKKKQLEAQKETAKAKKAASRAANKAKADSKPNPKK